MRLLKSAFIVVGAVTMLVFGLDVAVQATTGHGFLLGVPTP